MCVCVCVENFDDEIILTRDVGHRVGIYIYPRVDPICIPIERYK